MEVKKANVELYKTEARFYNKMHIEIFNEAEQNYIDEILSRLWKKLGERNLCLDVGCGTGNITKRARSFFNQTVGLDISRDMLLLLKTEEGSNLLLVCGDCEHLPFRDGAFNFISMYSALHHLPHPFLSLKEIFRTLKSGGIICIAHEPNALKYRLLLYPFRWMFSSFIGRFVTKIVSDYPHFISRKRLLGQKADIYAQRGFLPNEINLKLALIGFSNINVAFHDLFQLIFAGLPNPFRKLVEINYLLERNKMFAPLCATITIIAEK